MSGRSEIQEGFLAGRSDQDDQVYGAPIDDADVGKIVDDLAATC